MDQFIKNLRLQNNKSKHQDCIKLKNYMEKIIKDESQINKSSMYNYNTECIEFQLFVEEINKLENFHIVYETPHINNISTNFDTENNINNYNLYNKSVISNHFSIHNPPLFPQHLPSKSLYQNLND